MDLRTWITGEHAAVLDRFEQSVVATVPLDEWRDGAGPNGSSIAWLAFHTAYHEDVAINAAVRGGRPVIDAWRDCLGLTSLSAAVGLGEAEDHDLTASLDLDQLVPYVRAVHDETHAWLPAVEPDALDGAADGPAGLAGAGIDEADVPWLYRMWDGRPVAWFLQWEAIGHRVNHVGEMVSVRNRLGRSPF